MSLIQEALKVWYSGLGQTVVGATCPLIVGPLLLVLLSHASEWTPHYRHFVYRTECRFVGLWSILQSAALLCGHTAIGLQRGLLRLSFLGSRWVRFWQRVGTRLECVSSPRWGERKVSRQDNVGWDRPARLWKRIKLTLPFSWVVATLLCSLVTPTYVLSSEVVVHHGGVLPLTGGAREETADVPGLILSLWFAVFGLLISGCNFISVLTILAKALCAKAVWLTVRQKWVKTGLEESYTLTGRARVYDNGEIAVGAMLSKAQVLFVRAKKVWSVIRQSWITDRRERLSTVLRSAITCADRETSARLVQRPFFELQRKKGEWKVTLPRSASDWCIGVRRPSTKRLERLKPGDQRAVQEGDVMTFGENEQWYMFVERLYPE